MFISRISPLIKIENINSLAKKTQTLTPNTKFYISLDKKLHRYMNNVSNHKWLWHNKEDKDKEDKDKPSTPGTDLTLLCRDEDLL